MKISPIKFSIAFRGEKDENQPLSPALRDVFSDRSIPKPKQKLLWELSEVPYFYEASKDLTKDEFIKLSDLIKEQETNILEMALKGDVRIISKKDGNTDKGESFFKFAPFVKHNGVTENGAKKSVLDFIKEHPIFKIANDVMNKYRQLNIYPDAILYEIKKDEKGNLKYTPIDNSEAEKIMLLNAIFTGSALSTNNAIIVFNEEIKGKNDFIIKYVPVAPENVEELYPVEPECLKMAMYIAEMKNPKLRTSITELAKIPYFRNLVRNTHPGMVLNLAKMNADGDGILAKMFRGDTTIGVFDPNTKKESKRPVIDKGKLLLDMKNGNIKQTDLYEIIKNNTMAIEVYNLYKSLKDSYKGERLKYSFIIADEKGLIIENVTTNLFNIEKKYVINGFLPKDLDVIKKLSDFTEKVPLKRIAVNYSD